jgi:glycosyltransferase involved in cell wall biosynthesis
MSLSVIIITRNEANNIGPCLDSVSFAKERIVLDYASTDDTVTIAKAKGARVIETQDWPGFGPQKNQALGEAQYQWVLCVDADERVSPELARAIQRVVVQGDDGIYACSRRTQFCGRWIKHSGWAPDYVCRLFPRSRARFSEDKVHERLVSYEPLPTKYLSGYLWHYSYPGPEAYWRKLQTYSTAWAEQQFSQGATSSMWRACFSGVFSFVRSYIFRLGLLDGAMGFAVCVMQAQAAFAKHFHLYFLQTKRDRSHALSDADI